VSSQTTDSSGDYCDTVEPDRILQNEMLFEYYKLQGELCKINARMADLSQRIWPWGTQSSDLGGQ